MDGSEYKPDFQRGYSISEAAISSPVKAFTIRVRTESVPKSMPITHDSILIWNHLMNSCQINTYSVIRKNDCPSWRFLHYKRVRIWNKIHKGSESGFVFFPVEFIIIRAFFGAGLILLFEFDQQFG